MRATETLISEIAICDSIADLVQLVSSSAQQSFISDVS